MDNPIEDPSPASLYTFKPFDDKLEIRNRYRRRYGLILGIAMGLVLGLVSQLINPIALPGIPLYQPPLGPALNILLFAAIGGTLGIATVWSPSSVSGIFAGAGTATLITAASLLISGSTMPNPSAARVLSVAFLSLPIAAAFVPVMGIFRWIANRQAETRDDALSVLGRYGLPALAILLAGVAGAFWLYPSRARVMIPRMHAMLQTAAAAPEVSGLPGPLQPPDVDAFSTRGHGYYELLWDRDETNKFAIPRYARTPEGQGVVIARFDNGYLVACLWPDLDPASEPECRDY